VHQADGDGALSVDLARLAAAVAAAGMGSSTVQQTGLYVIRGIAETPREHRRMERWQ
jgi:hypothetical protein